MLKKTKVKSINEVTLDLSAALVISKQKLDDICKKNVAHEKCDQTLLDQGKGAMAEFLKAFMRLAPSTDLETKNSIGTLYAQCGYQLILAASLMDHTSLMFNTREDLIKNLGLHEITVHNNLLNLLDLLEVHFTLRRLKNKINLKQINECITNFTHTITKIKLAIAFNEGVLLDLSFVDDNNDSDNASDNDDMLRKDNEKFNMILVRYAIKVIQILSRALNEFKSSAKDRLDNIEQLLSLHKIEKELISYFGDNHKLNDFGDRVSQLNVTMSALTKEGEQITERIKASRLSVDEQMKLFGLKNEPAKKTKKKTKKKRRRVHTKGSSTQSAQQNKASIDVKEDISPTDTTIKKKLENTDTGTATTAKTITPAPTDDPNSNKKTIKPKPKSTSAKPSTKKPKDDLKIVKDATDIPQVADVLPTSTTREKNSDNKNIAPKEVHRKQKVADVILAPIQDQVSKKKAIKPEVKSTKMEAIVDTIPPTHPLLHLELPQYVVDVMRIIEDKGYVCYVYGGPARDRKFNDVDIITTIPSDELKKLFPAEQLSPGEYREYVNATYHSLRTRDNHFDINCDPNFDKSRLANNADITINTGLINSNGDIEFAHPQGLQHLEDGIIKLINYDLTTVLRASVFSCRQGPNGKQFKLDDDDHAFIRDKFEAGNFDDYKRLLRILDKLFLSGHAQESFAKLQAYNLLPALFCFDNDFLKQEMILESGHKCLGDYLSAELQSIDDKIDTEHYSVFYVLGIFYAKVIENMLVYNPLFHDNKALTTQLIESYPLLNAFDGYAKNILAGTFSSCFDEASKKLSQLYEYQQIQISQIAVSQYTYGQYYPTNPHFSQPIPTVNHLQQFSLSAISSTSGFFKPEQQTQKTQTSTAQSSTAQTSTALTPTTPNHLSPADIAKRT